MRTPASMDSHVTTTWKIVYTYSPHYTSGSNWDRDGGSVPWYYNNDNPEITDKDFDDLFS